MQDSNLRPPVCKTGALDQSELIVLVAPAAFTPLEPYIAEKIGDGDAPIGRSPTNGGFRIRTGFRYERSNRTSSLRQAGNRGFEPLTRGFGGRCSDQAELISRVHIPTSMGSIPIANTTLTAVSYLIFWR